MNFGRFHSFYVVWCSSMAICYDVILRIFSLVPTKPVENILEGVDHVFHQRGLVTGVGGT